MPADPHRRKTKKWPNRTPSNKKVQPSEALGCTEREALCGKGLRPTQASIGPRVALGIFPGEQQSGEP
ncbi:hypothetical protein PSAC2689_40073 [Paraburkholderia sacchari]